MRSMPAACRADEQARAAADVVLEVPLGYLHRLARRLVRREVHHRVDGVVVHHPLDECSVGDVTDFEWRVDHCFTMAVFERVEHHDVDARVSQRTHRVRPDVPRPARDQHAHASASSAFEPSEQWAMPVLPIRVFGRFLD